MGVWRGCGERREERMGGRLKSRPNASVKGGRDGRWKEDVM